MVGSMQESPTLLILRCRARHNAMLGSEHSLTHALTHSTPGSGRAFPPMQLMGGSRWEPGCLRSHSYVCRAVRRFF